MGRKIQWGNVRGGKVQRRGIPSGKATGQFLQIRDPMLMQDGSNGRLVAARTINGNPADARNFANAFL